MQRQVKSQQKVQPPNIALSTLSDLKRKEQDLSVKQQQTSLGMSRSAGKLDSGNNNPAGQHNFAKVAVFPQTPARIQPKLKINSPGDKYEQEADAMAEQVMRMPMQSSPKVHATASTGLNIQRQCAACAAEEEQDEEKPALMRKAENSSGVDASPTFATQLNATKGGGSTLPLETRRSMEQAFGTNFSAVRVHTDDRSAQMSQDIRARAFTHGRDIYFNKGQYSPESGDGRRLLGHELTHVVQQGGVNNKNEQIRRAPASDKSASYDTCNEATTFRKGAAEELARTLDRAKDFLDVAISKLEWDYTKYKTGSVYRVAMTRHFINPTKTEREKIRSNLISMRNKLDPKRIRCASSDKEIEYCFSLPGAIMGAFYNSIQDKIYLCPNFWNLDRNCRAITLVHEAAHAIGLGMYVHPPYRGSATYPYGSDIPSPAQSTATRMENPEAYAFFAAHIWRELDKHCLIVNETIMVTGSAPE